MYVYEVGACGVRGVEGGGKVELLVIFYQNFIFYLFVNFLF